MLELDRTGAEAVAACGGTAFSPSDTTTPIVTTSSVLAVKFKGGVAMAADTLASYGRMCRFKDMRRYLSFNENTLMATSGDVSDHQMLQRELEAFVAEQTALTTGAPPTPKALANLTSRILYLRRSKMNPYWLSVVVAGVSEKPRGVESQSSQDAQEEVFLGCTDMLGTFFQENFVATGLGRYFAMTLMREKWRPDLTEGEAKALLEECMRILFYRDCAASNRVQFAFITKDGIRLEEPTVVDSNWDFDCYTKKTIEMDPVGCSW